VCVCVSVCVYVRVVYACVLVCVSPFDIHVCVCVLCPTQRT
jgi:hypothetical protein